MAGPTRPRQRRLVVHRDHAMGIADVDEREAIVAPAGAERGADHIAVTSAAIVVAGKARLPHVHSDGPSGPTRGSDGSGQGLHVNSRSVAMPWATRYFANMRMPLPHISGSLRRD